ncbi:phage gp6-like head-tail connector protein [Paenibacillus profundus]|uniref:Phage gp6-like head-tail connector protein n=1 Tax=Paenibacillus profundus TaxID=1173085 RepID=A0ABS8Y9I5_9BACL|nr:phage head-tail connector protein [Paenibacillus profundus]MCE5168521.1 phage gp6-like head-tail connector protein [Paenibacillus profundus]
MLCTLERFKRHMSIPEDDKSMDDELRLYLMVATQSIEKHCKRTFRKQTYTEQLNGYDDSPYVNLRNYPIHKVISIMSRHGEITDYESVGDGRLFRSNGWPNGKHNLTVTYVGGYVLPGEETDTAPRTLPETLEFACILYAQSLHDRQFIPSGVQTERLGEMSVTYAHQQSEKDMPPTVISLINPYVGRWY